MLVSNLIDEDPVDPVFRSMDSNRESKRQARRRECQWGLYVILDAAIAKRSHLDTAAAALAGGAKVVQLRDKQATFEQLVEIGRELRQLTRQFHATLIINDNPYLAREIEADGVHIGQSDFPPEIVRDVVGPDKIVGLSTHNKQQIIAAQFLPIDYIGIGPVYETGSKKSEWPTVGTSLVRWAVQKNPLPVVAIGGINKDRIVDVIAAGAHNVAIIGDLMSAENIQMRTAELQQAVEDARRL